MIQAVPYVILSRDMNLLNEFIAAYKDDNIYPFIKNYTYSKDKVKNKPMAERSTIVFDPSMIISLEHCCNFNGSSGKTAKGSMFIEITFVDAGYDLDAYFMNDIFSVDALQTTPFVFPRKGAIEAIKKSIRDSNFVSNLDRGDTYSLIQNKLLSFPDKGVSDATVDLLSKPQDAETNGVNKNLYWIAYGVGSRSNDWCHPVFGSKASASFTANGTSGKRVSLRFVPFDVSTYRSEAELGNSEEDVLNKHKNEAKLGAKKKLIVFQKLHMSSFEQPYVENSTSNGYIGGR